VTREYRAYASALHQFLSGQSKWRRFLTTLLAASATFACSEIGSGGNQGNVEAGALVNAALEGDGRFQALVECASLMRVSEELVDRVARTKTGTEQSQLTMEMTFRGGRARLLRLDAIGPDGQPNRNAARIDQMISSRAAAIVRGSATETLEQHTDRIRLEADRCYDRLY